MHLRAINKTMDRDDLASPECRLILIELFGLMRRMRNAGVHYSSWYGRADAWPSVWEHVNRGSDYQSTPGNPDELRVPWFLLWEIAWLVANTPIRPGARVLDMGGAGSLFTCYLASRGMDVHTIDLQDNLCRRTADIADRMKWRLTARQMDMSRLEYPDSHFDHVFSVCVFEHLPVSGRIQCNEQVARVLRPGGSAAYTFDYANPQSFGRIDTPDDVMRQFVEPSRLKLAGDGVFHDNGKRYLETPQCFGFGRFTRGMATVHAAVTGQVLPSRAIIGTTSYSMGAVFLEK
ncbi:MAG: class I SAM-dependent methyltransferase [Planctomycetota bacterium]